jgi:LysR family transcriptional activator of mexEF-oprN operon
VGKRLTEQRYFEHEHVIVSYSGDLRGVVEDALHKQRRVRCSLSGFSHIGSAVEGSALLATVPEVVAQHVLRSHPRLRTTRLPFQLAGTPMELLWPAATDDDEACRFLRSQISAAVSAMGKATTAGKLAPSSKT